MRRPSPVHDAVNPMNTITAPDNHISLLSLYKTIYLQAQLTVILGRGHHERGGNIAAFSTRSALLAKGCASIRSRIYATCLVDCQRIQPKKGCEISCPIDGSVSTHDIDWPIA